MIDSAANRYSFVEQPIELEITGAPKISSVSVPVHPDKKETKKVKVGKIFISKKDFASFKGQEIRLLHLYNIKLDTKLGGRKVKAAFTSSENKNIQKINWVSFGAKTKILMPSGKWVEGLAEQDISDLKTGEIIQFERFGFCRLDKKKGKESEFWFAHK
jgi:glutamyl-tRNA synthetase